MKLAKKIKVLNKHGLHLRPASLFAERAKSFKSSVLISTDSRKGNGKSVMDILSLGVDAGHEVTLQISGPDAEAAMQSLEEILVQNF